MIRLQQIQKWIKLQKKLVASLLCFKVAEIKMCLLPCSIWRASFSLLIKKLNFSNFNRLSKSKIWIREFWSKLKKMSIKIKRKSRKKWAVSSNINKLLKMISTAKSTLIFLKPELKLIPKRILYSKILMLKTKMLSRKFLSFVRSFHQNSWKGLNFCQDWSRKSPVLNSLL